MRLSCGAASFRRLLGSMRTQLRLLTDPDESFPGPLGVLRRYLNSDRACDRVVPRRKTAQTEQILDALACNDVSDLLEVQGGFRHCNESGISAAKYCCEFLSHNAA
jgi:hypothetical protein